jgi:nicotinamide-nucleotide amidase
MTHPAVWLIETLVARRQSVAVAESLTGGLLAAAFVEVAGASRVFRGGLIAYATDLKATLADVPTELLQQRGPVDPDVAVALAQGARHRCGATWGIATTGVAGPEPQDGKPVGTAFVAVAGPAGNIVRPLALEGDRARIRNATVVAALELMATALDGAPLA